MTLSSVCQFLCLQRITAQQVAILLHIKELGQVMMKPLGDHIGASQQNISTLIRHLEEKKGWVSRSHIDGDRRHVYVSLTDRGKEVLKSLEKAAKSIS